jgi:hypothetical protein
MGRVTSDQIDFGRHMFERIVGITMHLSVMPVDVRYHHL